ncbi:hypothetical protein BD311DRAFT_765424 [Dichomitus squalens]|uniref:Uncharacterized protein n=1 Tax=Dichomitus squalens TaxID=114155 RepID=A0A4Q9MGR4_9APHY|nr:hypothetical protein BD311DRAFT_765424 [Dichomitus squalens]
MRSTVSISVASSRNLCTASPAAFVSGRSFVVLHFFLTQRSTRHHRSDFTFLSYHSP